MSDHEELMKEVVAFLLDHAKSEKPSGSFFGGKVPATEFACIADAKCQPDD